MTRKMKFICVSFIPHIAEMIDNQSRLQIAEIRAYNLSTQMSLEYLERERVPEGLK